MNSFRKKIIDYNPIVKYIQEMFTEISPKMILVDTQYSKKKVGKYKFIFLNVPLLGPKQVLKNVLNKKISNYNSFLSEDGYVFLNCPYFLLESTLFVNFRELILKNYYILGIISFHYPEKLNIAGALLILSRKKLRTTLASITTNTEELKKALSLILLGKGGIPSILFEIKEIKKESFSPFYYHPRFKEVEEQLEKYEIRELGEISEIIYGFQYRKKKLDKTSKYRFLRLRDIQKDQITETTGKSNFIPVEYLTGKEKKILKLNDLLISNIFNSDRIALVSKKDIPAIPSHDFFIVRCHDIDPLYLYSLLTSEAGKSLIFSQIERKSTGLRKRITQSNLSKVQIPIFSSYLMNKIGKISSLTPEELIKVSEEVKLKISSFQDEETIVENLVNRLIELGWEIDSVHQQYVMREAGRTLNLDLCIKTEGKVSVAIEIKLRFKRFDLADKTVVNKIEDIIQNFNAFSIPYLILVNSFYEYLLINFKTKETLVIEDLPTPKDIIEGRI